MYIFYEVPPPPLPVPLEQDLTPMLGVRFVPVGE